MVKAPPLQTSICCNLTTQAHEGPELTTLTCLLEGYHPLLFSALPSSLLCIFPFSLSSPPFSLLHLPFLSRCTSLSSFSASSTSLLCVFPFSLSASLFSVCLHLLPLPYCISLYPSTNQNQQIAVKHVFGSLRCLIVKVKFFMPLKLLYVTMLLGTVLMVNLCWVFINNIKGYV